VTDDIGSKDEQSQYGGTQDEELAIEIDENDDE